ncbi:MAG: GHKL domain-containing protein [Anaerovoracaceae bacterium]
MDNLLKYLNGIVIIVLLLAIGTGFFQMGGSEVARSLGEKGNSIHSLSSNWEMTTDKKSTPSIVDLPSRLPIEGKASSLTLSNTLPSDIDSGTALRLQTLSGWYDIYIDGTLRAQYGNHRITDNYWYDNPSFIIFVKLTAADAGKEIRIHTGSIDSHHLAIQREPLIGQHPDFIMGDMIESTYGNMIIILMVVSSFILLCVWCFFKFRKQTIQEIPRGVLFLLMMTVYYNVGNVFMLELLNYSPSYFGLNDFFYYVMNVFIPIAGYIIVLPYIKVQEEKFLKGFIFVHILFALFAFILQIVSIANYEPVEKVLMIMTIIGYLWLLFSIKNHHISKTERWFVYPVFICILGIILDYYKYMLNLDWLPEFIAIYLQVDSPFMIFLPLGMIVYLGMLLIGIVYVLSDKQTTLALTAKTAELRATLAENEFFNTLESMNQIRKMRHDLEHHFSVITEYIVEDKKREALSYIEAASDLMPNRSMSGTNIITNTFVEKYRMLCKQNNVSFSDTILYDESLIANKTDLGIILGNGLKNAFESATTASKELRFVRISGKRVLENITIIIENGYDHALNPDFKSTKAENRGLGLTSIDSAIERCNGYNDYSFDNRKFTLQVVIPLK